MGPDPKRTPQDRKLSALVESSRRFVSAPQPSQPAVAGQETVGAAVARLMMPFLLRDDGWLRVTPQEDGQTIYWKWKWTAGKHTNHYVMVVYPAAETEHALLRLADKVNAVDSGEKTPVKDHYFKG